MHDRVKDNSWAFWLLGKGFTERANAIIALLLRGQTCLDQDLLYNLHTANLSEDKTFAVEIVYPNLEEYYKEYTKDIELWAEFLTATPIYLERVTDFFKEQSEE